MSKKKWGQVTVLTVSLLVGLRISSPVIAAESTKVTLVVTGDVMLARTLTAKMRLNDDYTWPFKGVRALLAGADLAWINLESPFGKDCSSTYEGMVFCADEQAMAGLVETGIDLASLANNHALDQGEEGLVFTRQLLERNFIKTTGLGDGIVWSKNGVKLGLLSFNAVVPRSSLVAWAEPEIVAEKIKNLSTQVDAVIVYFHWGEEYTSEPIRGGGSQFSPRQLARTAIEAGAELVVGAHPHVVQPPEWYQGKLIIYSLGNFIFDQNWSRETQRGMVGRFVLDHQGLSMATFIPVEMVGFAPLVSQTLDNPWRHP